MQDPQISPLDQGPIYIFGNRRFTAAQGQESSTSFPHEIDVYSFGIVASEFLTGGDEYQNYYHLLWRYARSSIYNRVKVRILL